MPLNTKWGTYTVEQRELLRKAYEEAVKNKQPQFTLDGQPVLTDFAKYLLQYLDS